MITGPGVFSDLDEAEYHSDPVAEGSLSVSGAKLILKSPAHYAWEREHRTEKRAFDFGHAAHAMVLGIGSPIVAIQKTAKDGTVSEATDLRTVSSQEHQKAIRDTGSVPLLRTEIEQAQAMAAAVLQHPVAALLFRDGEAEKSMFWRDDDTKVMLRGRLDWLTKLPNGRPVIVDYKTTAQSADPNEFRWEARNRRYHMQDRWYVEGMTALGLDEPAFLFVVQEKSPPFLVSVIELHDDVREDGTAKNIAARQTYLDCRTRDEWPGYPAHVHGISWPTY